MAPNVLVPEFEPTLTTVLQFFGMPTVFIGLVLTVLAVDSWLSNVRRATDSVRVVGRLVGRGGLWLFQQHPARLVMTAATTVIVLLVQYFMIRLSYVGGSLVGMPLDPVRRAAFDAAYNVSPSLFVDTAFLARFLKLDVVTAGYMAASALIIGLSYRSGSKPLTTAVILSFPYSLFLFGSASLALITVGINGFLVVLGLLARVPPDWTLTNQYVLSNASLTIDLVCGIYCLGALAAVSGARVVRRLWTVGEDVRGAPK